MYWDCKIIFCKFIEYLYASDSWHDALEKYSYHIYEYITPFVILFAEILTYRH